MIPTQDPPRSILGIVFDLDGTLIDSRGDIAAAALHALRSHGFPELPAQTLFGFVGDGAKPLLSRAANIDLTDARLPELYAAFIEYYSKHPVVHTHLSAGASETLEALSHLPLTISTNKPRVTMERVLEALGITDKFRVIVAGDDLPAHKPDPLPVVHIAERLGVRPAQLVMVGDGAQDVLSGRRAGARTVGVRGGIQPEERLVAARPDVLIETLSELPGWIARWEMPD